MKNFTYHQPTTVAAALPLLAEQWGKSELLAGGTDLHDLQKEYVAQPDKVVSLTGLGGEFKEIAAFQGGSPPTVIIGAGTKLVDIAESRLLAAYPALTGAAAQIAGPQIRNMGTLGGSLCQRNRCWYFRDEHVNCLLKGGRKCYAQEGENQFHAIFTQGHPCVIVHPRRSRRRSSRGGGGKMSAEGRARVARREDVPGTREGRAARAHAGPNEILLSRHDRAALGAGMQFANASYEVKHRQTCEWPLVQASVAFNLAGKVARNVRVVPGHVAPTPMLSEAAAKALEGKEVTEATAAAAGEAACEGVRPLSQNAYKVKLLAVAVKRAALLAAGAKPYWEG